MIHLLSSPYVDNSATINRIYYTIYCFVVKPYAKQNIVFTRKQSKYGVSYLPDLKQTLRNPV